MMLQTSGDCVDMCQGGGMGACKRERKMKANQLQSLNQINRYPHSVQKIDWRETHISWVILTGEFVYKIKKPVDFGFLDFSTLDLRRHFCEEEIRLNQRTAPELYLEVVPLCSDEGGLNFNGSGEVLDYAVKMRQFDPDALMLNMLANQTPSYLFLRSLGYELAQFHADVSVADEETAFGTLKAIAYPVEENFRQIRPLLQSQKDLDHLDGVKKWSLQSLQQLAPIFNQRKTAGKIRECHGDLHLGNIAVINDKAVMFDCIEFNTAFRWIDVASDIAFLIMDMEFNGYTEQANVILNSYLEYSFDYSLLGVLNFYRVYRAMVRAKVLLLRLSQGGLAQSEIDSVMEQYRGYIAYAKGLIKPVKAYLAITSGVSGTGKSTFSRALCGATSAIHLRSDVARKNVAGLKPLQDSSSGLSGGIYSAEYSQRTFELLRNTADAILDSGYPVVLDATFLTQRDRSPFLALGVSKNVATVICELDVTTEILVDRINQRNIEGTDPSEATVEVLYKQLDGKQEFSEDESSKVVSACDESGQWHIQSVLNMLGISPD